MIRLTAGCISSACRKNDKCYYVESGVCKRIVQRTSRMQGDCLLNWQRWSYTETTRARIWLVWWLWEPWFQQVQRQWRKQEFPNHNTLLTYNGGPKLERLLPAKQKTSSMVKAINCRSLNNKCTFNFTISCSTQFWSFSLFKLPFLGCLFCISYKVSKPVSVARCGTTGVVAA